MSLINFFTEFFRESRQDGAGRGESDSENIEPFNLLIFIFFKFAESEKFSVDSSFNKETTRFLLPSTALFLPDG